MSHHLVRIRGCRQNNLKNISIDLPKGKVIVITGVSGSGKSSLAFDTLFAEGQRRYLEYLSPQVRTWIKQMPKPDVDLIEGLSPTLAVGQHRGGISGKNTIATHTDIYDFLAILYAAIGEQHSPITGKKLVRYTRQEIINKLLKDYAEGTRIQLLAPVKLAHETLSEAIQRFQRMGFIRFKINDLDIDLDNFIPSESPNPQLDVIVDRIEVKEDVRERLTSSIETALDISKGILKVQEGREGPIHYLTEIFVCPETGLSFAPLTSVDFNFNSQKGICPKCLGEGHLLDNKDLEKVCPLCRGGRLKPESLSCLISGKGIHELCALSVKDLLEKIRSWNLNKKYASVSSEILPEIISRLEFLERVGLGYLELNRLGPTLSEGETQRVQLAAQIGAKLSGIMYILDEPTLGLHSQDIANLWRVIENLRQLGNTVIMVEHERSFIVQADHIVEIGPGSGIYGGQVTFQGTYPELLKQTKTLTGAWLSGKETIPIPTKRKKPKQFLKVQNANLHNLKKFNASIPMGVLMVFCGVSGSGKSSLVIDLIAPEIRSILNQNTPSKILDGYQTIRRLNVIEQKEAGISSRSIPATYIDIMTPLRSLFAKTKLSQARGYTSSRFSLNKKGGRCDACEGMGQTRVSMQFMPDLYVPCEVCSGSRYNFETLQITWQNHSIADVLALSVEEALQLFKNIPDIGGKLHLMKELGLDYLTLGQNFTTLSGGEIQRLKLVADLVVKNPEPTLYILDEPSAGLHFQDTKKLIKILHQLADAGHSVFVVEHNLDIVQQADWILELGPEGGPRGGNLIFEGTPEKLFKAKTPTGEALRSLPA